ncbi:MAG: glycosyltransferase family 39 protein [Sphingomicrobium sp.]
MLLVALAALLINPVGYTGGGADDVHYLAAGRCWVAHGSMCLPHDHWAARWPAVMPVAAGIAFLGDDRATVGLGALAGWIASITLVGLLGRLWFDRAVGLLAAAVLASTPIISAWATQPSVDLIELALQLAALALATMSYRRQSARLACFAGVAAALAVQARETSVVFCAVSALAWLLLDRNRRRVLLWALAGFAGSMAVEIGAYAIATGDPLFRYRLAMGHVAIPSEELARSVDTRTSPLFNPAYIAGWRREMGIHWWWAADPWLNLLASPRIGLALVATALTAPFAWRNLPAEWRQSAVRLLAFAVLVAVLLVYALAVDPKPRMFLALLAAASIVLAAMTIACVRAGRPLIPVAIVVLLLAAGLRIISITVDTRDLERRAGKWVAGYPNAIQIDRRSLTTLMLVDGAPDLPESGRPLRIVTTNGACEGFGSRVIDRIGGPPQGELCLIETRPR